jgi:sigma-54 dependent transcriptional regulator, flagellar regulatory protein
MVLTETATAQPMSGFTPEYASGVTKAVVPNTGSADPCTVGRPTGTSPAITAVNALIRQVAGYNSTVLLLGESGTGKEVAARAIHDLGPRRNRPFIPVNCGAIPAELLESELFGHERGAFTGAIAARTGRFEMADGGTVFLDEIGDMSLAMQVKLLRVLQERVFERVGNHKPIRCDVRIIAATHRNLDECVARGTFREDLFYRLNVFPIVMPPLRERTEDLPQLVSELVAHGVSKGHRPVVLSPRTFAAFARHSWAGNVRELANLIERLSILCADRTVEVNDLPTKYWPPSDWTYDDPSPAIGADTQDATLGETGALAVLESGTVHAQARCAGTTPAVGDVDALTALERSSGTVAHAARLLGLHRTTLVEKLRKLDFVGGDDLTPEK